MMIPDAIAETGVILKDRFFDLRGLSAYSSLSVSAIREHIRRDKLPAFKVRGKILIRESEFKSWIEAFRINHEKDLNNIVDGVIEELKKQPAQSGNTR